MDTIQNIINHFNAIPASTWSTIGAYLGGSTLVATVLQLIKHKFSIADRKKLVTLLLGALSFIAALADLVISTTSQNPAVLGQHTAMIAGIAVFIHRFMVSPVYHKVVVSVQNLLSDAQAYRATISPPAVSEETPVEPQQFSV